LPEIPWDEKLKGEFYRLTVPMTKQEYDEFIASGFGKSITWSVEERTIDGEKSKRTKLVNGKYVNFIYQCPKQKKYVLWRDRNFKWKDSQTGEILSHPPLKVCGGGESIGEEKKEKESGN